MPYLIKTNKGYVKRTAKFGPFYGNVVLTEDINEARRWTRENDAISAAGVVRYRTRSEKTWEKQFGGQLETELVEV